MPLIVVRVHRAKPTVTLVAEDCGGLVARLVQVGNRFARRLYFLAWILAGLFRFHDDTRSAILPPSGKSGKKLSGGRGLCARPRRSAYPALRASGVRDRRYRLRRRSAAAPRLLLEAA